MSSPTCQMRSRRDRVAEAQATRRGRRTTRRSRARARRGGPRGRPARRRRERGHGCGSPVGASGRASSDMPGRWARRGGPRRSVAGRGVGLRPRRLRLGARRLAVGVAASAVVAGGPRGGRRAATPCAAAALAGVGRPSTVPSARRRNTGACAGTMPSASARRCSDSGASACATCCSSALLLDGEVALRPGSASRSRTRPARAWC